MMKPFPALQQTNFLAIILIIAMMLAQFVGPRVTTSVQTPSNNQAISIQTVSTCPQAKAAQTLAGRLCQYLSNSTTAILADITTIFLSLTCKLDFLFVAAMLAIGWRQRLFKPPQSLAAV